MITTETVEKLNDDWAYANIQNYRLFGKYLFHISCPSAINYGKIVNADIIDNKVRCRMCFAEAPSLMQLEALLNKEIEYEKIATIDLKYMDFEKWLNEDYNPPKI